MLRTVERGLEIRQSSLCASLRALFVQFTVSRNGCCDAVRAAFIDRDALLAREMTKGLWRANAGISEMTELLTALLAKRFISNALYTS